MHTRDALGALEEKNVLPLLRIEPIFYHRYALSLVTMSKVYRLLDKHANASKVVCDLTVRIIHNTPYILCA